MILWLTAVVGGHRAAAVAGVVNLGICIPNAVWSSVRCIWLSPSARISAVSHLLLGARPTVWPASRPGWNIATQIFVL